jgi:hypothetical protein
VAGWVTGSLPRFLAGVFATLLALGVALFVPSVALADLGLLFPSPRAHWGQRVTVSSLGRYAPFAGVRVYLVPIALARSSRAQRPTGPPRNRRIVALGPLRLSNPAVAKLSFTVPRVPPGDYTIGFWCKPCAPPRGAFFTTAQPHERWTPKRPARILRISRSGTRGRFSSRGITFLYPSSWYVTTKPLSNGVEPVYRFAVGNFRFHRTARDIGPCLEGIAKQRAARGVLAFMREAIGTDARRTRAGPRPKTFRLPSATEQTACLGSGSNQVVFREAGRTFYLWISIAPKAARAARGQLKALLNSMTIKGKTSR